MARRRVSVFSLSFLDAITCGFGAVILLYMVINANVALRADRVTVDLQAEVDRMQDEVLDGHRNLVELRNALREIEERIRSSRGLSRRLIENLEQIQIELATYDADTIARRESLERLQADLRSLEEGARRLSGGIPDEDVPGDRIRSFVGDGDRQYLTGLKVGGRRILVLVDTSASMLGDTLVNVLRRRNLPEEVRVRADKWQRALLTVDWISTQLPRDSRFQLYAFDEAARPVLAGTDGQWLSSGDPQVLASAVQALRETVPRGGTSLFHAFRVAQAMSPAPDNVILLVDGLPTWSIVRPRGNTVTGKQRLKYFQRAVKELPRGLPVNVILFPLEGDPSAASAYWRLAVASRGSFLSPSEDWP